MSTPIDWTQLLVGRQTPPPGWWVALAIERGVSTVELRSSAVVALLAPAMAIRPGPPPYLPQLPGLAEEWLSLLRQHAAFVALREQGMATIVPLLVVLSAARDAMAGEAKAPDLVPELQLACKEAAAVIRALEAAGIPLSARNTRLSVEEKAAFETEAGDLLEVYREQRAERPMDGYLPLEKDPQRRPTRRSVFQPAPTAAARLGKRPSSKAITPPEAPPSAWLL
jgi:hypothetical protein